MTLAVNIAQGGSNNVTFRNKIINGAMVIDQRNAGASVAVSSSTNTFITDRWSVFENTTAAFTWQQVADAPSGLYNSLKCTITTANSSPTSSDLVQCKTTIEGYNIADLNWGATAASAGQTAKPITLSFWVKSTLTGTFGGALGNASLNRSYAFTYTISSANTWTQASVTIAGDTSGTWGTDNSLGMYVFFDLGTGSSYIGTAGAWASADYRGATGDTKVANTLNATWQITGVQLEAGTTASPFEYRQYGTELALCQRYFETNFPPGVAVGSISLPGFVSTNSSTNSSGEASGVQFSVKKRAVPTIVIYHITNGNAGQVYRVSDAASVGATAIHIGQSGIGFLQLASSSANGYYWNYTASAEL